MEFAGALDYQANIIEQHFDPKGIELATIHGAKGRQWPLVIVAGVQEGELPHARSLENADDPAGELEGERRLAYVAFTRASSRLVLLYAADEPTRFIAESALVLEAEPVPPSEAPPPIPSGTRAADPTGGRTADATSGPRRWPSSTPSSTTRR